MTGPPSEVLDSGTSGSDSPYPSSTHIRPRESPPCQEGLRDKREEKRREEKRRDAGANAVSSMTSGTFPFLREGARIALQPGFRSLLPALSQDRRQPRT